MYFFGTMFVLLHQQKHKTMKNLLVLLVIIVFASCSKDDDVDCNQLKQDNFHLVDPENPNDLTQEQQEYAWEKWVRIMDDNGCSTTLP